MNKEKYAWMRLLTTHSMMRNYISRVSFSFADPDYVGMGQAKRDKKPK
jgi:hypothetical protein